MSTTTYSNVYIGNADTQLPKNLIYFVIAICVLPFILHLVGVDFSSEITPLNPSLVLGLENSAFIDGMFFQLSGAFQHALLEWSAFTAAIFTVVLAFSHYSISKDITTPIIGVALFCAGSMDAFHTLAAARLIDAVAPNQDLIPFTWAICRIFNAAIMILGVSIFLCKGTSEKPLGIKFIVITSMIFGAIAFLIISYCANSANLPQTQFPDATITRPYDVIPLLMFLFAGVYLYPKFYRKTPNLFTHALIISAIPEVAVEFHMAFGSSSLFDSHFNIAHFLKIVAYVVPLLGLILDYVYTYRKEQKLVHELEDSKEKLASEKKITELTNIDLAEEVTLRKISEQALILRAKELERSNQELGQFAYVASHDLQEPLRMVASYTQLLSKRYKGKLDSDADEFINYAVDGANRMQVLINDLLTYSRVESEGRELKIVDLQNAYDWAFSNLELVIGDKGAIVTHGELPKVYGDISQLGQLLQNLMGNAVKFVGDSALKVVVSSEKINGMWRISVTDTGIGISEEFQERIFVIFQRLHNREEFEGTGIGLAVCKKIVERHGGEIGVISIPGKGSTFWFTLHDENYNCDEIEP